MEFLNISSLNCRGLKSLEKRTKLYTWLNDIDADIILLQETHFIEKHEFKYNTRWFGNSIHNFSDSPFSRGTSILFKKNIEIEILDTHKSNDGRILFLNYIFDDKTFSIINVYAPNNQNDRKTFFEKINSWIRKFSINSENIFIAGDFNCNLEKN